MRACRTAIVVFAALVAVPIALPQAQTADDFFNSAVVDRVDLWLHSLDWEKLKANFQSNEYYPADVSWNGVTVRNVAIRSRGAGSRNERKPGLRVDCDRNVDDQTCVEKKSFILDNLTQDPSAVHETVAVRMLERLNIPAPREGHTRLYVNGEYVGLYAKVESIDKSFLARIFGSIGDDTQNDGFLYDYEYILDQPWYFTYLGSDLAPYKLRFDPVTHERATDEALYRPIETLVRLANELPSSQFQERLSEHLDLNAFVRFLAGQNFIAEPDGFLGYAGMNNFYFYRLENRSQHVFIAWDLDTAFAAPDMPLTNRHDENVLARKVMEVAELRDLYFAILREAVTVANSRAEGSSVPWLEEEVRRQLDLIAPHLAEDPAKPYTMDDHANARAAMINFARQRGQFVTDNLPR